MCEFDYTIGKYHVDKPIIAHKVFADLEKKFATFWKTFGHIARGKWIRWDDEKNMTNYGSPCPVHENGFHCFTKPVRVASTGFVSEGLKLTTIPVKLKGDITVANQFGDEILVGEWIYVPTDKELREMEEPIAA